MKIKNLELAGFRNIKELKLCFNDDVNIIYGDNAQGKTNLIESLWLLTGAKSFRGAHDADFINFDMSYARVKAVFFKDGREQTAQLSFGEKKAAELNGISLPSVTGFAGVFCAVVFSPSHLGLIQEGPAARRRFADTCICQLSPKFIALLSDYNRTLMQRNSLLKDISYSADLLETLDIWDDRLAALAALIIKNRGSYLKRLGTHASEIYKGISCGKEALVMRYVPCYGAKEPLRDGEDCRTQLLTALKNARGDDLRTGVTSVGPHRDDIIFEIENTNAKSFASQGQQRSTVLALKLAESRLLKEILHDEPVILLDDVMSELDKKRQSYLLNNLSSNQVFITCCDKTGISFMQKGKLFHMENGRIEE
ncbi:MAG: DNA replication/repair protein RecF [Hydrogenoanaerobacterium sp.]